MQFTRYITRDRGILGGKPIIKGTRIAVDDISTYLSYGLGVEDIKKAYPALTNAQIKATLDYLDDQVHREREKLEPASL